MRWCSWVICMLPAALQLCAPTALAADMPQEVVGSWSQQKTCSNAVKFDHKGYTTFIDGKGHRCDVKRVVALKNQFPTTPAWRLELSCDRRISFGNAFELRISTVIRINIDNAPHIMALAEKQEPPGHARSPISLAIYFRCN